MVHIDNETNDLAYRIIGCAYKVHKELGPGLLESAYESCFCYELNKNGIQFEKQKELPVFYDNKKIDCGYRMDVLVENTIIVELKTVDQLIPIHTAQVMTYLRLSKKHLALLINFNVTNLQNGIKRYVL